MKEKIIRILSKQEASSRSTTTFVHHSRLLCIERVRGKLLVSLVGIIENGGSISQPCNETLLHFLLVQQTSTACLCSEETALQFIRT